MQMQLTKQMTFLTGKTFGENWATWAFWGSLPTPITGAQEWATWIMSLQWRRSAEQVDPLLLAMGLIATFV